MNRIKIKPTQLLYDIRLDVSTLLGVPFTEKIDHQAFAPHRRLLAVWALDCAEKVLPYFEEPYPDDPRPRQALETLQTWIATGEFKMKTIRGASLAAHAAAKDRSDQAAVFAAHAAGQAVATPHVPTHAFGSSLYAIRAVIARTEDVQTDLITERNRQLDYLKTLFNK